MIDFRSTSEAFGIIEYYNLKGETVKTYPLSDLELYVELKEYHIEVDTIITNGKKYWDPECEEEEISIETPISEYIDDNWEWLTKEFYNFKNPINHLAKNTEQETLRSIK